MKGGSPVKGTKGCPVDKDRIRIFTLLNQYSYIGEYSKKTARRLSCGGKLTSSTMLQKHRISRVPGEEVKKQVVHQFRRILSHVILVRLDAENNEPDIVHERSVVLNHGLVNHFQSFGSVVRKTAERKPK